MSGGTSVSQLRNSELVDLLSTDFQRRNERMFVVENMFSLFQTQLGLRSMWTAAGNFADSGAFYLPDFANLTWFEFANHAKNTLLGGIPCLVLDGTDDYVFNNNMDHISILGNEASIHADYRGLTVGGWFQTHNSGTETGYVSRDDGAGGNHCFILGKTNADAYYFNVNNAAASVSSTFTFVQDQWAFIVGKFDPSTLLTIYVNGTVTTSAVGVPATINNVLVDLDIGRHSASNYLNGYVSYGFMCAATLPDTHIRAMFEHTRYLYGV